jgi:CrcB protein
MTRRMAWIGIGGAVGASVRWAVLTGGHSGGGRLALLLAVNLAGCLVLGAALALPAEQETRWHRVLHDGVGTGFCGGLTTFSTVAVEVAQLGREGRPGAGAAYIGLSVVLGLAAVLVGARLVGQTAAIDQPLEGER